MTSLDEINSAPAVAAHEVTEVTHERAFEIIETLTNTTRHETDAMLIVKGLSEVYGMIYVAVPPLGNSLLLPFASHFLQV